MAESTESQGSAAAPQSTGKINASCGATKLNVDGAGKTVAQLRKQLGKYLNIGPDTKALVNGTPVEDEESFTVSEGQHLEFIKVAGQKGC